jgi:hypothetical protein
MYLGRLRSVMTVSRRSARQEATCDTRSKRRSWRASPPPPSPRRSPRRAARARRAARPNDAKVLNRIEKQLKTLNATTAAQWKRLNAEVASLHSDVGRDSSAGSRGQLGELRSALSGLQRSLDAIAGNTAFEDVN